MISVYDLPETSKDERGGHEGRRHDGGVDVHRHVQQGAQPQACRRDTSQSSEGKTRNLWLVSNWKPETFLIKWEARKREGLTSEVTFRIIPSHLGRD